jgi:hypothetical protein
MAQVNVYVPDDLKRRLDEWKLPLSQLAQTAWERELRWQEEAEAMDEQRIETLDRDGNEVVLRFVGDEVAQGCVYRTDEGKAILLDEESYWVWEPADIEANEEGFGDDVYTVLRNMYTVDALAEVLEAFDLKPIVRL